MKTVPTLCATATTVGVSAVGLSLGRPESSQGPSSSKRKAFLANGLDDRPMPSTGTTTLCTPQPPLVFSSPLLQDNTPSSCISDAQSYDGQARHKIRRRMTSGDVPLPLKLPTENGYTLHDEQGPDEFDPSATLRSRSSWIKRLSTLSSQSSGRNSTSRPASPSVSCSNGSMAFSHDGSTTPFVGKRDLPPLPPNKLVKRTSSLRNTKSSPFQTGGSRMPTLRRPATSHQRSATLYYSSPMETTAEEPYSTGEDRRPAQYREEVQYTQYFGAKVPKESTGSKNRNSSTDAKIIKRIFPDSRYQPTLLLAKSVTACSVEVDESSSQDGDSVHYGSRPATPSGIARFFSSSPDTAVAFRAGAANPRNSEEVGAEARPRRSFSISDMLSSGSNALKSRPKSSGSRLVRKSSKRTTSAPLISLGNRLSVTTHDEGERPAKRRDITDPTISHRELHSSEGTPTHDSRETMTEERPSPEDQPAHFSEKSQLDSSSSPLSPEQTFLSGFVSNVKQIPPSPTLVQAGGRPSRHSVAHSEQASTLVGSDNETRGLPSGDEDDFDFQSDTVFDSMRTRTTRSTSGARGPRIETIFDESPPSRSGRDKIAALRDLLPKGAFADKGLDPNHNHRIMEEDETLSTPAHNTEIEQAVTGSPTPARANGTKYSANIPSTPPDVPKPLSLGTLEWDTRPDDDDSRWPFDEDEAGDEWNLEDDQPVTHHVATPLSIKRSNPRLLTTAPSTPISMTSKHLVVEQIDRDTKSSIFDWSERPPSDKSPGNHSPPRPKTVHGKKDADGRGSRSLGRRAPSALHARSQSVPVVPDIAGNRSPVVTNKFGTWGVGSKGVTEDWNDDFDFSDPNEAQVGTDKRGEQRADSGLSMIVPKNIQEQQSNVLANIGLLREWGLLIEELKELRIRAVSLGILDGPYTSIWQEVDAMIDLADQEAEEETAPPRLSPPSSPGIDLGAFDELEAPSPSVERSRRKSSLSSRPDVGNGIAPFTSHTTRARRKSILPPHNNMFSSKSSPASGKANHNMHSTPPKATPPSTRPRKNSEAVARSVIEALQKRRSTSEPLEDFQPVPPGKKVPFDTATLRHIVPYVNGLMRKVKDAMREAEGLYTSPTQSPKQPPFSQIFQAADNELATQMKLMTVM